MLADPCADPGILARVVQARLPENSSDNGFCLFFSMVYFKENYNFTRFRGGGEGGGCPTYSRGVGGRGLGVQMLILETHRTFDFPGGGTDPISPSGSAHVTI